MATPKPLTFAQALRRARLAAGLTQEELAERAGLAVRSVSDLERGVRRAPYRDTVERLAGALSLSGPERAALEAAARPAHQPGVDRSGLPSVASHDPSTAPFVGRASELARIGRALAGEGPSLLLLAGEPGIGKSRLLREAISRATELGWAVLEGGCQRSDIAVPYAPLVGALARHIARRTPAQLRDDLQGCSWLVRLLPELADSATVPLPRWTGAPDQERRLMFTATARYLTNVAGPAGTLLVLDDMQWAGGDALELLAALLREPGERPLCAIIAHRAAEARGDHPLEPLLGDLGREGRAERLVIGPLSAPEAKELLGELLEGETSENAASLSVSLSAAEAEWVLRRTDGVPFYLVSCVRALQAGVPEGESPERVPWSVSQQIRQRAAALPEAARMILGLAAVAGRNVELRQLRAVASAAGLTPEARLDAIETACRSGLLVETRWERLEGLRFTHDLIHEVTLTDLSATRRRGWNLLHAEALEHLPERERERHAADIARHFLASDEPARARLYLLRAGDQAEATYAHGEAEGFYRAALDQARQLGELPEVALALDKLYDALANGARFDAAIEVVEELAALYQQLGDAEGELRALHRYGIMYIAKATPDPGLERLDAARVRFAASPPSPDLARYFAALAQLYFQAGRAAEALATAERAVAIARECGDTGALAHALYMRGMTLGDRDQPEEFEQAMEEVIPLAEQIGDAIRLLIALSHTGNMAARHGDFARASERLTRAAELAALLGEDNFRCGTLCYLGCLAYIMGDWDRAESLHARAMTVYRRIGPAVWSILAPVEMARLRWAKGQRDEARDLVLEALASSKSLFPNWRDTIERDLLSLETEEALLGGDATQALALLERHFEQPLTFREHAAILLAWAYLEAGQEARATETLTRTLALAERNGDLLLTLDARRIQALLAIRQRHWSEAEALLDEVVARCHDLPYPYAEAKALWASSRLYAERSRFNLARERDSAALAILSRLGERVYAAHIEAAHGSGG